MSEVKNNRRKAVGTAALILGLLFLALTCMYQVRVTSTALVSTLGRPGEPVIEPGLYFKAPFPIQRVYVFDRRAQLYDGLLRETLTSDGLSLVVRLYAVWEIQNAREFYEKVGFQTDDGTRILSGLLGKYASDVLGRKTLKDLVSLDADHEQKFRAVEAEIQGFVAKEASAYGITVRTVGFSHLGLPESITKAVFERMTEDRGRLTEKIRSEGERDAKLIRTRADQEKAQKISEAEAAAMRIRGAGDTEAYRHFKVFEEDPEFALYLRKLEALEKSLESKATIILDRDVPPYDLLRPEPKPGISPAAK